MLYEFLINFAHVGYTFK